MIKFFHYPICPLSRQIRVYLAELNLEVTLVKEAYWEIERKILLKLILLQLSQ